MKPLVKQLDPEGILPFSLVYNQPKGNKEELPNHLHDWCEVIYIHEGSSIFFIDQTFYELKKGDLILVPPNVIHRSILESNAIVTSTALYFLPTSSIHETINHMILMELFLKAKKKKTFRHSLGPEEQRIVEKYLSNIHKEKKEMNEFWEEAAFTEIIQLMIRLNRWLDASASKVEKIPTNFVWMKRVLDYVEEHLSENIRLEELASEACLSPVYFSKKFKQTVGITVSDFLVKKRLLKAKELLKESDDSIQSIAERSGYQSMPHFYRSFKKEVGQTPSKYRKNSISNN
ncbi:helix-turn-helix domain-containing protein [Salibacterium aidingense]|uniref:helix-turn-helix domain-containing protein n=1 Tax=Salibacterium aidingense TaxID=384933 RepID=UPI003BC9CC4F